MSVFAQVANTVFTRSHTYRIPLAHTTTGGGRSELNDAVGVPVGVLEPSRPFLAQLGDPLFVRLDPFTVVLLKDDAVGGEFIDRPFQVNDLPGGDRAS